MNWYGSGFITIINYSSAMSEALTEEHTILTENNLNILTESSQDILIES